MVRTRTNPRGSQEVGQGPIGIEARHDQILERLDNLEQERAQTRVEKEVPINEDEGEKYSHGHNETHGHKKERSPTPSEERNKKCMAFKLSKDMKKIAPPKFEGSTNNDEAKVWLVQMEKYFKI